MFTLMEYTIDGQKVCSAVHYSDLRKFLAQYPDAKQYKR